MKIHARKKERASFQITTQEELELEFSKFQLHTAIHNYFVEQGWHQAMEHFGIPVEFGMDALVQLQLHKRATVSTMAGSLRKYFEHEENPSQACADELLKLTAAGFCYWQDAEQRFVVKFMISEELQAKIDQFQYPLPMIEQPRQVTHNRQTGYHSIGGSIILKNNHHNDDVCLDHINRVNSVPLAIDTETAQFIQNRWKNLDRKKPDEDMDEFRKRKDAFEIYDSKARDVLDALMVQGDRLWLTHRYDKRGRTYAQGYHFTYQGNDWCKAICRFADAEPLNKE